MGKIQLEGLEFFAHHGYYQEEQKLGNRYTVDISLHTEFGEAASEDNLEGTVNYEEVYQIIRDVMNHNTKLLEHIAHKINQLMLEKFPQVDQVETKVSKHNPPLKGICRVAAITLAATK
jgi:dihydroneopterin aldolase